MLCGVDVEYNFPEKEIEVIVFGCPRVGNSAFAKSYNKRVFQTVRVENGNDIVTKVPFILMGYRHVGMKVHVGRPRLPFFVSALAHYPASYYQNMIKRFWGGREGRIGETVQGKYKSRARREIRGPEIRTLPYSRRNRPFYIRRQTRRFCIPPAKKGR